MDVAQLKGRIDALIDRVKTLRRRPGVPEILVPGEPEHLRAENNRRLGIPLGAETVRELEVLAAEYQIPLVLEPFRPSDPERSERISPKIRRKFSLRSE